MKEQKGKPMVLCCLRGHYPIQGRKPLSPELHDINALIRCQLRFFSEAPRADSSIPTAAVVFPKESDTADA